MAKLTLTDIQSGYNSNSSFNNNNTLIETAIENTLSRDGTGPNAMGAELDMNSNKIVNLAAPTNPNDAARFIDIATYSTGVNGVSFTNANGFTGTVVNPTTLPVISVGTSISGVLKGDGTAISAASPTTDYVAPGSYATRANLTLNTGRLLGRTTASSGAAEEISVGTGLALSGGSLINTFTGGTVTNVSMVNSNGFSGVITNPTTTPELTLSTSITGILSGNGTAISAATTTGSGSVVLATTPTLVTPVLGVATATTINGCTLTSGTLNGSVTGTNTGDQTSVSGNSGTTTAALGLKTATTTVAIDSATAPTIGQVLVATSGTGATWQTLSGTGDALTSQPLSQFAATTSAQLAGVISDETGTGALVFATSPTLITPLLGTPTSGTLTNCTGLPIDGLVDDTTSALGIGTLELGHASDTTLARVSAGVISVEGITIPTISSTSTLTNKRVTLRVGSTTSATVPVINTDNYDIYQLTAQAVDITSFTTNLSGAPTEGQGLIIEITGTAARAITWGTSFESSTVTLPTTTVTTEKLTVGFIWNSATSKWRCVGKC